MKNSMRTIALSIALLLGFAASAEAQIAAGYYARFREQAAASVPTPTTSAWQHVYVSSSDHKVYRKNSAGTSTEVGGGTGTVTSVICGTGLTGGTITATGTCAVSTAQGQSMAPTDNTYAYGDATHRLTAIGALSITAGAGTLALTGADVTMLNAGSSGFATNSGAGNECIKHAGNCIVTVNGSFVYDSTDVGHMLGVTGNRWKGVMAGYYDTKMGAQLTAAATITPTTGFHHVTGATHVTTIALTNFPYGNPTWCGVADGGTITFDTGGNVGTAFTIASGHVGCAIYDLAGTTWYPLP